MIITRPPAPVPSQFGAARRSSPYLGTNWLRVLDTAKRSQVDQLSLSRLKHGQPGVQAHPEIVQGATAFHHQITDARLPQAEPVFHDAAALDTAVDMLAPQPPLVERLVRPLLLPRQLLAAGFLGRHEDYHPREREGQEPQILQEPAP